MDMDEKAVNYLFVTWWKHLSLGDSPSPFALLSTAKTTLSGVWRRCALAATQVVSRGKMEATDMLRMAELFSQSCYPNSPAMFGLTSRRPGDQVLWDMRKSRLDYKFHPFFWEVGGHYTHHRIRIALLTITTSGFHDCFDHEPNVPFSASPKEQSL